MQGDPRNIWQKSGWVTLQVIAVLTALTAIGLTIRFLHARWTWNGGQWRSPVPRDVFSDHFLNAVYNLTPFVAMLLLAMVAWWIGSMKRRTWYWPTPAWRRRCIALSIICAAGALATCIYVGVQHVLISIESARLQANDPNPPNQFGMVSTGLKEWRLHSFFWWSMGTTVTLSCTFGVLASYAVPRESNACDACNHTLTPGQVTCPECGTPQVSPQTEVRRSEAVRFTSGLVASPYQPENEPRRPQTSPDNAG